MTTSLKNYGNGTYAVVDPCEPTVALGFVVRCAGPKSTSLWEAWGPADEYLGKSHPSRAAAVQAVIAHQAS